MMTSIKAPEQFEKTEAFLRAVWGGESLTAFLGVKHQSGKFENVAVTSVNDAIRIAQKCDAEGQDVYFSCATFKDHSCRKQWNANVTRGFWLDLDCGAEKAASGKGYATKKEAWAALVLKCREMGWIEPNWAIDSGNGLHVYWLSEEPLPAERWKSYADKLKALTHHHGLLADDTRTTDIASVLRVPGTHNFKDPSKPKLVQIKRMPEVCHAN